MVGPNKADAAIGAAGRVAAGAGERSTMFVAVDGRLSAIATIAATNIATMQRPHSNLLCVAFGELLGRVGFMIGIQVDRNRSRSLFVDSISRSRSDFSIRIRHNRVLIVERFLFDQGSMFATDGFSSYKGRYPMSFATGAAWGLMRTARSMDCKRASAADRVCDCGEGVPNNGQFHQE